MLCNAKVNYMQLLIAPGRCVQGSQLQEMKAEMWRQELEQARSVAMVGGGCWYRCNGAAEVAGTRADAETEKATDRT